MNHTIVEALGWSIIHSLWECCISALLYACFSLLVRSANIRYIAGCIALLLMLAVPGVTFLSILQQTGSMPALAANSAFLHGAVPPDTVPSAATFSSSGAPSFLAITVWLWLTGVIAMTVWSAAGWIFAQRLKWRSKHATPEVWQRRLSALAAQMHLHRTIRLYESVLTQVPAVIGWIRPVILVPAGALINLGAQELEAVLAHELAHVRRYDYLVNLLQTVFETLLFYHPAVWWIGRRVRAEREHCCDDLAVQSCGDRLVYARALTSLEELRGANPNFAMAATGGGELSSRIRRLFDREPTRRLLPFWLLAAFPVVLSAVLLVNTGAAHAHDATDATAAVIASTPRVQTTREAVLAPGPATTPAPIALAQTRPEASGRQLAADVERMSEMDALVKQMQLLREQMPLVLAQSQQRRREMDMLVKEMELLQKQMPQAQAPAEERRREVHALMKQIERLREQMPQALAQSQEGSREMDLLVNEMQQLQAKIPLALAAAQPPATPQAHHGEGYLAGLADAGYTHISVDEIIFLKNNGVSPDYIKTMLHAGLGVLSPKDLVRLKTSGVPPEYARAVKSSGIRDADVEGVVRLHQSGVRPELLEALGAAGFNDVSVAQAIQAQSNGLSGAALRSLREQGFKNLTLEQVIKLKRAGVI